jgi:dolichol-phosphate mannosyltransferase
VPSDETPFDAHAPSRPTVSVVVPTFREAESLPYLIDRLGAVARSHGLRLDLTIVDDDSRDGTVELVRARPEDWLRLVVRTADRGLSQAALQGLRQAQGDVLVCMDADLSHPPEAIPAMLTKLAEGADFVIGSRYVEGGSTAHDWGFLRWANSRVATWLARPLTHVSDPMSGFFALRRRTLEAGRDFNPIGYKIGLELIVKCRCERVVEIPIHFADRRFGASKLTLRQQLLYLDHLRRLLAFKHGLWTPLVQFLVVGGLGVLVNLVLLTLLLAAAASIRVAVALAILGAMCSNFALSRRGGLAREPELAWPRAFVRYVAATAPGALVNWLATLAAIARIPAWPPQAAALLGIAIGAAFNFTASRYLAFRARHVRVRRPPA